MLIDIDWWLQEEGCRWSNTITREEPFLWHSFLCQIFPLRKFVQGKCSASLIVNISQWYNLKRCHAYVRLFKINDFLLSNFRQRKHLVYTPRGAKVMPQLTYMDYRCHLQGIIWKLLDTTTKKISRWWKETGNNSSLFTISTDLMSQVANILVCCQMWQQFQGSRIPLYHYVCIINSVAIHSSNIENHSEMDDANKPKHST